MISEYERTNGLIPKVPPKPHTRKPLMDVPKLNWCVSTIMLALLGSRWNITPELLFPSNGSWDGFWSDDPETWPKETVNSMARLELPSERTTASKISTMLLHLILSLGHVPGSRNSTTEDRNSTETLFFATTVTPPRLDKGFLNPLKSHYDPPNYHFLRLVRVPRVNSSDQAIDVYIVLCDSPELQSALGSFFMSQSFSEDGSPKGREASPCGDFPISVVRSFKQYVIHQLCQNLDGIKSNLQEAVRTPTSVRNIQSPG